MPVQRLKPEEEFVLDAAFGRLEAARRAVEQARRELGAVMRSVGLSAAARHLDRSRQWALQLAQEAEEPRDPSAEGDAGGDDLSDSIRLLGIIEPIVVEALDDGFLRVLDGHRRLRIARESGLTSLPVSLLWGAAATSAPQPAAGEDADGAQATGMPANVTTAEAAARTHRRVRFFYEGLGGDPRHRTVDVWGFVRRSDVAYIVGFDQERADERTFRLDRIVGEIDVVGDGRPPPEGFSAERQVWSQLDPAVVDLMRAVSRVLEPGSRRALEDWMKLAPELEPEG